VLDAGRDVSGYLAGRWRQEPGDDEQMITLDLAQLERLDERCRELDS
jgi:hypothetical protein